MIDFDLENKILEAQNKKLIEVIRVLSCKTGWEAIEMRLRWRQIFANEKELDKKINEALEIKN